MKRIIVILLLLTVFLVGCSKPGCDGEGNTLEDFEFLERGMSYEEIEACVGSYNEDVGSGIYILTYELDDGSILWLGFSHLDYLDYVSLRLPDGTGEYIIPPPDYTPEPTP